uniref:Beta/gamma crystallin 'Greek key' domain-containing protein n=1 Tax=Erpetoichthys calabaricus TaxID=27687 RepID=A0A8C4X4N8_ERPCA
LGISFYKDRNFQGRSYGCSSDCADMHSYFSRCNSIRVDNGNWVRWMGFNDCIGSCRLIPPYHGSYRVRGYWIFYEYANYRGRQYFLRPGEYRRFSDWGGINSTIGSFRRIMDFY